MEKRLPIVGFNNYVISNYGRVVRKQCSIINNGGISILKEKEIKLTKDIKDGYYRVKIIDDNKKWHNKTLHKLVYYSFNGIDVKSKEKNKVVCHINDDKNNNRLDNLFLGSQKDNVGDIKLKNYLLGLYKKGKIKILE